MASRPEEQGMCVQWLNLPQAPHRGRGETPGKPCFVPGPQRCRWPPGTQTVHLPPRTRLTTAPGDRCGIRKPAAECLLGLSLHPGHWLGEEGASLIQQSWQGELLTGAGEARGQAPGPYHPLSSPFSSTYVCVAQAERLAPRLDRTPRGFAHPPRKAWWTTPHGVKGLCTHTHPDPLASQAPTRPPPPWELRGRGKTDSRPSLLADSGSG